MAGNYPDVSSWRMAWDTDGTQFFVNNVQQSSGTMAALNSEVKSTLPFNNSMTQAATTGWVIIFPELRDLDGILWRYDSQDFSSSRIFQVSEDTTNGIDGTWVTIPVTITSVNLKTAARLNITWNTVLGIKGIRIFSSSSGAGGHNDLNMHLYGEPSPGENLQRLEIWHPTLDQRLGPADLDWGDVPRNTTETRQFRIKNMHGSLTANSVRAAMSALTDTVPSVVGQQAISKDGSTWASQQTLSSPLGPGAISPILYIRRTTPANATLSLWWYRLFADCTSWT